MDYKIDKCGEVYKINFRDKKEIKKCLHCDKKMQRIYLAKSKNKLKQIRRENIVVENDDKIRRPYLLKRIPYIDYGSVEVYISRFRYYCNECKKYFPNYNYRRVKKEELEKEILKFLFSKFDENVALDILNLKIPNEEQKYIINNIDKEKFYIIRDTVKDMKFSSKKRKIITLNPYDYKIIEYVQENSMRKFKKVKVE